MLKTILVVYLLAGRADVRVQYIVRFPTAEACQQAAAKFTRKAWASYPIEEAQCTFDVTKLNLPNN